MRFQVNVQDDVCLTLPEVDISPDRLILTYRIANNSPYRVYLVNQLFHRQGSAGFHVDENLVYAEVSQEQTLLLRKQLIEVPEELDVEAPEVPYVTPVEVDSAFQETLHLEFPIRLYGPYRRQSDSQSLFMTSQFTFSVGYILEDETVRVSKVNLPTGTKHLRIDYTDLLLRQRVKEIGPIQANVQVVM